MGISDQIGNLTGSVFGAVLLVIIILLALAWFLLPVWVWNMRDDMKRHLKQQEELLQIIARLEQLERRRDQ